MSVLGTPWGVPASSVFLPDRSAFAAAELQAILVTRRIGMWRHPRGRARVGRAGIAVVAVERVRIRAMESLADLLARADVAVRAGGAVRLRVVPAPVGQAAAV